MNRFTATLPAWLIAPALCLLTFALPATAKSSQPQYTPADPDPTAHLQPSIELTASSDQVLHNTAVTLMWNVLNAEKCQASGDWQGNRSNRGHETVAGLTQDSTFTLRCRSADDTVSTSVRVKVIEQDDVTVTLTASAQTVRPGSSVTLQWNAESASQCTASGDWLGPQPTAGQLTISAIDGDRTFSLSCGTGTSSALASVTVAVDRPKLEWIAPTEDVDGDPLLNLAGYRVYWGTESGRYTESVTIEDPGATEWDLLLPAGNYYIAMSALSADAEESELSNEIIKTIVGGTEQVAISDTSALRQTQQVPSKSLAVTTTAQPGPGYAKLWTGFLRLIDSNAQIYQTLAPSHDAAVCGIGGADLDHPVALATLRLARYPALATDRSSYYLGRYSRR